jgi:uncharacterized membrane protein YsdA (DUF1294 family)
MPRKPAPSQSISLARTLLDASAEPWRWFVVLGFAIVLMVLAIRHALPMIVPPLYLSTSVFAVLLYAFDKVAAMRRRWRISEAALLVVGLVGGWPGALIAQGMFRHKSAKTAFVVKFWISVIANCAVLGWVSSRQLG